MDKLLRTGIGYNLKALKVQNPDIYDKYRLLFAFFDEEEGTVYLNQLSKISRKAAHEFFVEMHPEIKELYEGKITLSECEERMDKREMHFIEEDEDNGINIKIKKY